MIQRYTDTTQSRGRCHDHGCCCLSCHTASSCRDRSCRRSRFDGSNGGATIESFAATLSALGFKMKGAPDESNKMFFTVVFVKRKSQVEVGNKKPKLKWPPLKACSYKRR